MEELLPEVLVPEVVMRVELDECERSVLPRQSPQLGQENGVVAAQTQRRHARVDHLGERALRPLEGISVEPGTVGTSP